MKLRRITIQIDESKFPLLQRRAENNHRYPRQEAAAILEHVLATTVEGNRRDNAGTTTATNQAPSVADLIAQ